MRAGVIVAGGYSTRFGDADKAVADLAGTPMIRRVADGLAGVVDVLVVNCRDDQRAPIERALEGYPLEVGYALDPVDDEGPMAGIQMGLREADQRGAGYAVVVACDMPFVDPSFVAELFDRAAGHDAAVPRPGEWFQTTQAVYRAGRMADACEEALAAGERKILAALEDLDYVVVTDAPAETFRNVNTPEDMAAAAARLG